MRARRSLVPVVAVLLFSAACGSAATGTEAKSELPRRSVPFDNTTSAGALEPFSRRLYAAVASTTDGNLALSPYSVAVALMMVRAGAAGATRTQLTTALGLDRVEDADALMNAIDAELARRAGSYRRPDGSSTEVSLATANAAWAQKGYPFERAFLDELARDYAAGLHTVDYRADSEASRQAINRWVSERTRKKIPELIPKGVLDSLTRLVLTNALFLKADWQDPFERTATRDGVFERLDGTVTTVPFMQQTTAYGYAQGTDWQAARLPLIDGKLALDVVLPQRGRLRDIERALTAGQLKLDDLQSRSVALALPRFRFRSPTDLVDALRAIGITDLFGADADLRGITGAERLFVSDVLHEAYVAVDETGIEAAAATAVVIKATAAPQEPVVMRVDRPFLFVVRDLPTNTTLFIGRVIDPTA